MKYLALVSLSFFLLAGCASTPEPESSSQTRVSGGTFVYDGDDLDREYSDEEIERFARAYIEVMAIQQRYHVPIQQAPTDVERQALIEESEEMSAEVIVSHGMTLQEFNAIAVRMPQDDEIRGRVQRAIQAQEEERLRELQEAQDLE